MVPPEHELSIDQHLMALHQLVEIASNDAAHYYGLNGVEVGSSSGVTLWRSDDGSAVTARDIEVPDGVTMLEAPLTATVHLSLTGALRLVLVGEGTEQRLAPDKARLALVRSVATYAVAEFANGDEELD